MSTRVTELQTEPFTAERTWTLEELPVLSAAIRLPRPLPEAKDRASRRVRYYYLSQSRAFLRYCETWLLPRAQAAARSSLASSVPVFHVLAELDYQVTWNQNGLWSLYTQSREILGTGTPFLRRWGDTWDLTSGFPLPLSACCPRTYPWRKQLLAELTRTVRSQEAAGASRFYENWHRALRQHLNPRNFYLTEQGLALFYPMQTIAPSLAGLPVFRIPYDPEGFHPPIL